jgi:hypothetical protein
MRYKKTTTDYLFPDFPEKEARQKAVLKKKTRPKDPIPKFILSQCSQTIVPSMIESSIDVVWKQKTPVCLSPSYFFLVVM